MKQSEEAIKVEKAAVKCLSQRAYKTLVKLNIALDSLKLKDVKFSKRHLQNCKKFSLVFSVLKRRSTTIKSEKQISMSIFVCTILTDEKQVV